MTANMMPLGVAFAGARINTIIDGVDISFASNYITFGTIGIPCYNFERLGNSLGDTHI